MIACEHIVFNMRQAHPFREMIPARSRVRTLSVLKSADRLSIVSESDDDRQ